MRWSGGAEQLLAMAGALRQRGHELVLACQPGSDVLERARSAGMTVEPLRMRQDYDVAAAWRVVRLMQKHQTELLHAQHPKAHAVGLIAAAWAKQPAFAVTRRVVFPLRKNWFSRLKYNAQRIDGYVAVSQSVKEEMVKGGISAGRIEVIPSVVHQAPLSREAGKSLRQEFKIPVDSPLLVHVANYAEFKGQDILLAAVPGVLKRFPKAVFLFVGRDTEKMQAKTAEMNLSGHVFLAGFRTDVPRFLAAADVFIMPSLVEAASTALREAMNAGLPVIGSRTGGIPESIQDGQNGLLVPPGDSAALTTAILRVLDDPAWARQLGERGRERIQKEFSIESAVVKMESFYRRLLNGRRTKS
jgi:glycosyltransferase involved in cell wall biosynthesis